MRNVPCNRYFQAVHTTQEIALRYECPNQVAEFSLRYEDVEALCGGRDGLDVIKEILRLSAKILKPNG